MCENAKAKKLKIAKDKYTLQYRCLDYSIVKWDLIKEQGSKTSKLLRVMEDTIRFARQQWAAIIEVENFHFEIEQTANYAKKYYLFFRSLKKSSKSKDYSYQNCQKGVERK